MIITIARQCGCGARKIGNLLAQHYGLRIYTRQNLMEIAKEKNMLSEMSDFFEEQPVDDLINAISSYSEEHEEVCERFCRTFNSMISNEDCVIIGRCGNHIFKNRKDLTSIFLHGSMEYRIKNIEIEKKVPRKEAIQYINEIDERRMAYHSFYTGLTWGSAADYDISIDCSKLGAVKSAYLIENFIESKSKSRDNL